jgi:hypothetical protein
VVDREGLAALFSERFGTMRMTMATGSSVEAGRSMKFPLTRNAMASTVDW